MHKKNAIILFSKVPQINRSMMDDPYAGVPWTDLDALCTAMLCDVIETAFKVEFLNIVVYRDQTELSDDLFSRFRDRVECRDMHECSFSQQIHQAIESTFGHGFTRIVVVLENNPLLRPNFIRRIFDQLEYEDDCMVISTTIEGKVLLFGMKSNHSSLFANADGDSLLTTGGLMQRLCNSNVIIFPTRTSYSIDSGFNLARLQNDMETLVTAKEYFPHRTYDMFKLFNKKYRIKKPSR
jgi:hypothetical protein